MIIQLINDGCVSQIENLHSIEIKDDEVLGNLETVIAIME
jgi:hypothetical protein